MKMRLWGFMVMAVLLVACAHMGNSQPAMTCSVAIPEGWKQIPTDEPILFITKDGGYKQFTLVQERPLNKPFQFTQRTIDKGMVPQQAAEVVVREIVSDQNIRNFSLLENVPAKIAGRDGFQLTFIYTDEDGFLFKTIYYGFINGDLFYSIRYGATKDEYFDKDLKTFEGILKSFNLLAAK
jgi:hypothetical protein